MPPKSSSKSYTYAIGRRKAAVANLKLFVGKGESVVNNVAVSKYFPQANHKIALELPFLLTKTIDKYHYQAKIIGGGKEGQLESLALAISRALQKIDKLNYTPLLRPAGLLTVDARVRQRRMVGTGGKSRRQKQSPKR
jgi:small subunit ribosomal protein S9